MLPDKSDRAITHNRYLDLMEVYNDNNEESTKVFKEIK